MEEQFIFRKQYRNILFALMAGGLLITIIAILVAHPGASRVWSNVLLNNQYFMGIALGAAFFLAVHRVALSGWHSLLQRIPDSMTTFLPVAFILMLLIYFGMHDIYHWSHYEGYDEVLEGKKAWLNVPFFFARIVFYFIGWIALTWLMRKNSDALFTSADIKFHNRRKLFAGLFLIFYAITVSASSWDWIMSLDAHWYSTIFGWYVLIGMFVTSLSVIILFVWFLKREGYLRYIRTDHVHDLGILLFGFSIFWAYLWFSQYVLIWYAHIPEETVYYIARVNDFKLLFFMNFGINFLIPFFGLIRYRSKNQIGWVALIAAALLIGHWIDYYLMIMPAAAGEMVGLGFLEIFMTILYAGVFIFIVFRSLSKDPLVVKNDPFIKESMNYEA